MLQDITSLIKTVTDFVDDIHVSEEEKLELKLKLAEVESKVSIKILELQTKVVESQAKISVAEQEHGSWLGKNWRPLVSIGMLATLISMGAGWIPENDLLMQIAGGFLGIYGIGRTLEKRKK